MKTLALAILIAVPRSAIEHLSDRFHGWRRLLRGCIAAINFCWERTLFMLLAAFGVLCVVCGSLAYAWFFGGAN